MATTVAEQPLSAMPPGQEEIPRMPNDELDSNCPTIANDEVPQDGSIVHTSCLLICFNELIWKRFQALEHSTNATFLKTKVSFTCACACTCTGDPRPSPFRLSPMPRLPPMPYLPPIPPMPPVPFLEASACSFQREAQTVYNVGDGMEMSLVRVGSGKGVYMGVGPWVFGERRTRVNEAAVVAAMNAGGLREEQHMLLCKGVVRNCILDEITMIPPENREKRDNTSNNLSGNSLVPDDVVIEILLRLPVKSLLRCKSVCKSWFGLIKSSNFISKHHHHENNHTRILVHHRIHDDAGKERYLFSLFTDEPHSRQDLNYLHMPGPLFRHVIGSYDGLVLLCDGTEFDHPQMALWNPATREFKPLPIPKSNLPPHFKACECSFGFGWDPLGNDYKVVLISDCSDRRNGYPIDWVFSVAVYALGSESWRHLDPFLLPGRVIHNSMCVTCVNGAYYWLTADDSWTYTILLFDMGSEVVREIPGPDNLKEEAGQLVLYNGSIAMLLYNCSGETVEFVDGNLIPNVGRYNMLE
ncbi:hypothetical protein RJ639_042502 [Escallonia herrerae]|uniref:F-box domain-containing protein n=1 Tax=Escallonia herrerae TaxID=1293975 RepID=A0AA88WIA4_9ASTE|nr:hypothetical protein RJ639_042502 [Escallonia herrerae]